MKHIVLKKIAQSLEKIMRAKSVTPKTLAQKSKIGYSSLIPIINGTRDFGITKLIAIANALDCTPNEILDGLTVRYGYSHHSDVTPPKYAAIFVSAVSRTYCMMYDIETQKKTTTILHFDLRCGQKHEEFLRHIITAAQAIILDHFKEHVHSTNITVFTSVQQYEYVTNRERIQKHGDTLFSKLIIESDAITNHRAIFGKRNGILITINDGNGITYSIDNGNTIVKLQGCGFPISDIAGNNWIGCEAIRHALNVKENIEPSTILSDRILALFGSNIHSLAESIILEPESIYYKASSMVRELIPENKKSQTIVEQSAELLLRRIRILDHKLKIKLPIALAGDLANLYKDFFPENRIILFKDKLSDRLLECSLDTLLRIIKSNRKKEDE